MHLVDAYPVVKIDGANVLVILLDHLGHVYLNDDIIGKSITWLVQLAGALAIDLLPLANTVHCAKIILLVAIKPGHCDQLGLTSVLADWCKHMTISALTEDQWVKARHWERSIALLDVPNEINNLLFECKCRLGQCKVCNCCDKAIVAVPCLGHLH
jgi:hypothetical protein